MIPENKLENTAAGIAAWIADRIEKAKAKTAVVGLSGGADSALVAILCKWAMKENVVVVKMPCHSSPSSLDRANELIEKFQLRAVEVKLDDAFDSISGQVNGFGEKGNGASGALRSCLRAPTLDFVAKLTNGLIIGTGNRDEDEMTRYFQKRGDGAVDCSPIAKLHKSEVYQLLRYCKCPQSIIDATPTADLWGPDSGQEDEKELGLTYPEVEWGIRVLLDDPAKASFKFLVRQISHTLDPIRRAELTKTLSTYFNERQLHVLMTLTTMEENSRHKAEMPPVFDARMIFE